MTAARFFHVQIFPPWGKIPPAAGDEGVAILQNGVSAAQNEAAQTDAYASYPSSVNFVRMFFGFAREIVGVQPTKKNAARRIASRTALPQGESLYHSPRTCRIRMQKARLSMQPYFHKANRQTRRAKKALAHGKCLFCGLRRRRQSYFQNMGTTAPS